MRTFRNRFYDIFDVINRIRNTCIFSYALICKINLTVGSDSNIFKQSVTFDGVINIRFAFFIKIDNFCIASAFIVEHAFIVPTVFIVSDQQTFRICR